MTGLLEKLLGRTTNSGEAVPVDAARLAQVMRSADTTALLDPKGAYITSAFSGSIMRQLRGQGQRTTG
jgi:hypothetical protein